MIFHPAIIALLLSSFLITFLILYSSYFGLRIVRKWDIKSGSEQQLNLERRTYLISTILTYVLGFQLISLFLYIYTADNLHSLFVGAMCAAGTLNVNDYGYPTLILKIVNFLFAGLWLVLNYADNRAYDYPLIKKKYVFLLVIALFVAVEMIIQTNYLLRLRADVITSCCGSLFSADAGGITSEIAALPSIPMKIAFYLGMAFTFVSGICFLKNSKFEIRNSKLTGYVFSLASLAAFIISIISLISFISLYFYELPTHHCPFCILQREYGYIGYLLYITLLGGSVLGMGVGVVMPFRNIQSLSEILPSIQRRFALVSLVLYFLFTAVVTYRIVFSGFKLEGY
jgi:hypothetical protein